MRAKNEKLINRLRSELERVTGSSFLFSRILAYDRVNIVAWDCKKTCYPINIAESVTEKILYYCDITDLSYHTIKRLYYEREVMSRREMDDTKELPLVVDYINREFNVSIDVIRELMKYMYKNLKFVAIEVMIKEGLDAKNIAYTMNVSTSQVYAIRRDYLKKLIIEEKNDS